MKQSGSSLLFAMLDLSRKAVGCPPAGLFLHLRKLFCIFFFNFLRDLLSVLLFHSTYISYLFGRKGDRSAYHGLCGGFPSIPGAVTICAGANVTHLQPALERRRQLPPELERTSQRFPRRAKRTDPLSNLFCS